MACVKLAILGCGAMGTAVLQGLLHNPQDWEVRACVTSDKSVARVKGELGEHSNAVNFACDQGSLAAAAAWSDIIILGCVPKDLDSMLSAPRLKANLQGKLVVSMLAGTSTASIVALIGGTVHAHVARMIPTMAARHAKSTTLLAAPADLPHLAILDQLLRGIGSTIVVPESGLNDAIAVGAACHAVMMQALDAVTDASVADGMPRGTAMELAAETLQSAAFLLSPNGGGCSPETLKAAMSTPAGITMNSYLQLQHNGVPAGIAGATRAAIKYVREMS